VAEKKIVEKATIIKNGSFDETGKPVGWTFDRRAPLRQHGDGTWKVGGYTGAELKEILDAAKARAVGAGGEELPAVEPVDEPAPAVESVKVTGDEKAPMLDEGPDFVVIATLTGVSTKKPAAGRSFKEMKFGSPELRELRDVDELIGRDVELTIMLRRRSELPLELLEKDAEPATEPATGPEDKGENAPDDAGGESEPGSPETQVDDPGNHEPGAEPEDKTKLVCTKCGADLDENPDDASQLVCVNKECGEVYTNPAVGEADFE